MNDRPDPKLVEWAKRALAASEPTPQRAARVKADLLAEAEHVAQRSRRPDRRLLGVGVAAAAIGVVTTTALWIERSTAPAPAPASSTATVIASGAATFERVLHPETRDELVRLQDGRIRVDVARLVPSRRVVVECDDARIVVRGTSFQVAVVRGRLQQVRVFSGRVEVQLEGQAPRVLSSGDDFRAPAAHPDNAPPKGNDVGTPKDGRPVEPSAPTARPLVSKPPALGRRERGSAPTRARSVRRPAPAAVFAPPAVAPTALAPPPAPTALAPRRPPTATAPPSASSTTTPPIPSAAELAFQRGWAALEQARYRAAARALAEADQPGSPVREEAGYWRAVALLRADKRIEAEAAFKRFLGQYAQSSRRGEAALLLARLRLLAQDPQGAKPWLRAAKNAGPEAVRARATALLEKIDRRPKP